MKISFSPSETPIILGLKSGKRYPEIAERLGVSEVCVRNRMHRIYRRLGCNSRVELMIAVERLEEYDKRRSSQMIANVEGDN